MRNVQACNSYGCGSGAATATVTPAGLPRAPTVTQVRGLDGSVAVAWDPTAPDGSDISNGSAVTAYTVRTLPGGASVTVPAGSLSATVSGLSDGSA